MYNHNSTDSQAEALFAKFKDLLVEYNEKTGSNIPTEYSVDLSESQQKAFDLFKRGESVLILGSAGTGKSRLIKEMYKHIQNNNQFKKMYLTSTTGISAYNIGGITINSFMGIGTAQAPVEILIKRLRYKHSLRNRIVGTDILVIDEISMMSAATFEKIDIICKTLRRNQRPFGGIQLVLTGDFLQLETIFNDSFEKDRRDDDDRRLIVESDLFKHLHTINLQENFRQSGDKQFIDILMRIRKGKQTEQDIDILTSRLNQNYSKDIIHLVSSNRKSQIINEKHLNKIKSDDYLFEARFTKSGDKETCDLLEQELKSQFTQKGNLTLKLRKGCKVMLIKNLNVENGLVNGSIGTVEDIFPSENRVRVNFDNGITETIEKTEWRLELDNATVVGTQIPLILAYAFTIHKSQSLSLDTAVLDLSDCFCNHMVYVALSRVRSLDGLFLKSFNKDKITVNKQLLKFIDEVETRDTCKIK